MACRFPVKSLDFIEIVGRAKVLVVQTEIKIFGLDGPMTSKQVFHAATNGVTPVEVLLVGIHRAGAARPDAAIIDESRLIVDTDSAAGCVDQPSSKGNTNAAAKCCIKVAVT